MKKLLLAILVIVSLDLPPFIAGINAKAEAIMISHNIVTSIDSKNPASLLKKVHNLLRNDLGFTGIIITDNLDMAGVTNQSELIKKAITSGNDLIITTDYQTDIEIPKQLLQTNELSVEEINNHVFRILSWKYYKGLL